MLKIKSSQKGFTLIELMVVISIIAVLSSVVLSALNVGRVKSREANRVQHLTQIRNALFLYASDHAGDFPNGCGGDWGCLSYYTAGNATCPLWSELEAMLSPYMKSVPSDPLGHVGNPTTTGACTYYSGDTNFYAYFPRTAASQLGNSLTPDADAGTCLGKRLLLAINAEGTMGKKVQDCQVLSTGSLNNKYKNSIFYVLE